MTLFQRLKGGWTTLKFVRVGLGGLILYSSIESGEVAGILVGSLFTIFALVTDVVCCATNTCYTAPQKNNSSINETIEYEELDTKQ